MDFNLHVRLIKILQLNFIKEKIIEKEKLSNNPQQNLTHFTKLKGVKSSLKIFKIALKHVESFGGRKYWQKRVSSTFVQRITKVTSSSTSLCFAFRSMVERRQLWQRFLIHVHAEKWNFHATCCSSLPRIAKRIRNCVAALFKEPIYIYIYRRTRVLERVWITRD